MARRPATEPQEQLIVGWCILHRADGKVLSTGPIARQIGKIYSNPGRARQAASNQGGPEWATKYAVVPAKVDMGYNDDTF